LYTKWERVKKIHKNKEVAQVMPVVHRESATAVVIEISKELSSLAEHLFVASWQQSQFSNLLKDIPPSWVVLNMDFSENYTCTMQQEVQSAHWGHNQVSIHPTVAYYMCPKTECTQQQTSTVQEYLIFVSDDIQHDASAVSKFVENSQHSPERKTGTGYKAPNSVHRWLFRTI
jgi:hypothetical protein